jgi:hypothetical protein
MVHAFSLGESLTIAVRAAVKVVVTESLAIYRFKIPFKFFIAVVASK